MASIIQVQAVTRIVDYFEPQIIAEVCEFIVNIDHVRTKYVANSNCLVLQELS